MGYYGRSIYRGDFYRGARGDFLDDIGTFAGTVGGYVEKGLSYIPTLGKVISVANQVAGGMQHPALSSPIGSTAPMLPALPGLNMVAQRGYQGGTGAKKRPADNAHTVKGLMHEGRAHRRMNACNPHALRRAMRRTSAFMGFAKKYVKLIAPHKHVELRPHPLKHHKKHG